MLVVSAIVVLVALVSGAVSLLGVAYPFRPFRTRRRALISLGGAFGAVIAATVLAALVAEPRAPGGQTATAPQLAAPPDAAAEAEPAPAPAPADGPATAVDPKRAAAAVPPAAEPAERFAEADFYWEAATDPYRRQIVAAVNRIARENRNCRDPDPQSVALSQSRSKPGDPVFFVTCGSGAKVFNIWFRPADATGSASFAAVQPLSRNAAADACEAVARRAATHPSTVRFSRVLALGYSAHASGNVRLSSTFTAKNALGLELKYDITCFFEGSRLSEHSITEAMR